MAQISANRGDIAEGIMGAALTAKFIKRQLGQSVDNLPQVNAVSYTHLTLPTMDSV